MGGQGELWLQRRQQQQRRQIKQHLWKQQQQQQQLRAAAASTRTTAAESVPKLQHAPPSEHIWVEQLRHLEWCLVRALRSNLESSPGSSSAPTAAAAAAAASTQGPPAQFLPDSQLDKAQRRLPRDVRTARRGSSAHWADPLPCSAARSPRTSELYSGAGCGPWGGFRGDELCTLLVGLSLMVSCQSGCHLLAYRLTSC